MFNTVYLHPSLSYNASLIWFEYGGRMPVLGRDEPPNFWPDFINSRHHWTRVKIWRRSTKQPQRLGVEKDERKLTVKDGVAHSKNPKKCTYHVTFDLDLDLEHTLDARWPGVHRVQVWWRSGHLSARRSDLRKSLQTDRRRSPRHCISSFLEWAKKSMRAAFYNGLCAA